MLVAALSLDRMVRHPGHSLPVDKNLEKCRGWLQRQASYVLNDLSSELFDEPPVVGGWRAALREPAHAPTDMRTQGGHHVIGRRSERALQQRCPQPGARCGPFGDELDHLRGQGKRLRPVAGQSQQTLPERRVAGDAGAQHGVGGIAKERDFSVRAHSGQEMVRELRSIRTGKNRENRNDLPQRERASVCQDVPGDLLVQRCLVSGELLTFRGERVVESGGLDVVADGEPHR